MRAPLANLHLANAAEMVRVASGNPLGLVEIRGKHDIYPVAAIASRSGKEQAASPMLLVEPLAMGFVVALLFCHFLGQ